MPSTTVKFSMTGLEDFRDKIRSLDKKNRRSVLTYILRRAGNVVMRNMKRLAPQDSGLLQRSIKVKLKVYQDAVVIIVGVQSSTRAVRTKVGPGRVKTTFGSGTDQWGATRTPARYGHLADKGRKGFTQTFKAKVGRKYYIKGHQGMWTATDDRTITRKIGPAKGSNFIERSIVGVQDRIVASLVRNLNTWMQKRGYS